MVEQNFIGFSACSLDALILSITNALKFICLHTNLSKQNQIMQIFKRAHILHGIPVVKLNKMLQYPSNKNLALMEGKTFRIKIGKQYTSKLAYSSEGNTNKNRGGYYHFLKQHTSDLLSGVLRESILLLTNITIPKIESINLHVLYNTITAPVANV